MLRVESLPQLSIMRVNPFGAHFNLNGFTASSRDHDRPSQHQLPKREAIAEGIISVLSNLPKDLQVCIIKHNLPHESFEEAALALAECDGRMGDAVMTALVPKDFYFVEQTIDNWVNVLRDEVEELCMRNQVQENVSENRFRSESRRRIGMNDTPQQIFALNQYSSITEVEICFTTGESYELLFTALSQLSVQKLSLRCAQEEASLCIFRRLRRGGPVLAFEALPLYCPNLKSLVCACGMDHTSIVSWDVICSFSQLTEISLTSQEIQTPTSTQYSVLRRSRAIYFESCVYGWQVALHIGDKVRAINVQTWLDVEEILSLRVCTNLRRLTLCLKDGAERCLPRLLGQLMFLRSLSLEWKDLHGHSRSDVFGIFPYEPRRNVVLQAIRMSPFLGILQLRSVRIHMDEVDLILKTLGPNLLMFKIDVEGQSVSPTHYIEAVLKSAAAYNSNLDRLVLYRYDPGGSIGSTSTCGNRALLAADMLGRRAPFTTLHAIKCLVGYLDTVESIARKKCSMPCLFAPVTKMI